MKELILGSLAAQTETPAAWKDADLWRDFTEWGQTVEPLPPDLDPGMVDAEWPPSLTNPTARLVLREDPPEAR